MTQDAPMRSKQLELFGKMHLGMDHVLAKLLLEAPPLPDALQLQTEKQSLATTWVQVTEAFDKRKLMLQRRKEKAKSTSKCREEVSTTVKKKKKSKEKDTKLDIKEKTKQKSKSRSSSASPRSAKVSPSAKTEKKSRKKTTSSPKATKLESNSAEVKKEVEMSSHEKSVLKKLRKLAMCQNVEFGTNKYKVIAKWLELDKGKNAGTSAELMELLTTFQIDSAPEKKKKQSKQSRRPSSESLDDVLRVEKRNKRKLATADRRRKKFVDEDEVVYESEDEEEEPEYNGGYSDSDEAEFVPELENSPPPEKPKKRARRAPKRQKKEVDTMKEEGTDAQLTSRDHLAAVVAKTREDVVVSGEAETKYLSYEKKPESVQPGATSKSAIVLDDSDEEEEEEVEEEEEGEEEEEKTRDSSTDDDQDAAEQDMFDLNEEDVYVVEAILCVKEGRALMSAGRRQKEADLYLVKWEGYDELTWEPDENIPRRLIEMFRERERAKRTCQYQIKTAHERREVTNVTTQQKEVIYMIQWINQEAPVWESRTTLPGKTQVWLDKVLGAPASKKRRETKVAKKYFYQ
ncbi:hypothetical protein P3T76_009578 [Phytophthora citrophthora]|uniref:Chromo domain-containing protein n=1 Tax=Phytophthora citrophthora TaxID=4793 RepID=A0AAD9GG29_9STRA|nr:hypothetical protein P3T76_009578 [Phytophthora citrophthora]